MIRTATAILFEAICVCLVCIDVVLICAICAKGG